MASDLLDYKIVHSFSKSGQKEVHVIDHYLWSESVLKKGRCSNQVSLERIKREVSILKDIKSKYYPQNYFFEYFDTGEFTIIEEFIESSTLREVMDAFDSEQKVAELFISLIEGLTIIWDNQIVHRDLKPENILIRKGSKEPVIIDLGIARDNNAASLTRTIYHSGPRTNGYCSPEQLTNNKDAISYKSDFFSIGIIMAELLIKTNPFTPSINKCGLSCNDNILNNVYSLSKDGIMISKKMISIIERLLMPQPYQRYRTYKKLLDDLKEVIENAK